MIAHLVLFKFRPDVARDDERVRSAVEGLANLPAAMPSIRGWEHGFNLTADAQAWDYGLRALFDGEADLHAYFDHPGHLPVLALWEAIADLSFCDFELS